MASISVLTAKLFSMVLIAVVGFVIVRLHVLRSEDSRVLSSLCVWVLQPCLILRAFQIEMTPERVQGFLAAACFGMAAYILYAVMLRLLRRPLRLSPIDEASMMYSNVGNLILPLVSMVLGSEYVFYASAMQLPYNFFMWTHGVSLISGDRHFHWKKIVRNPNVIALALGLLLFLLKVRIPSLLDDPIASLSGMVGAVSMLVIGMVIGGRKLASVFTSLRAWLVVLGRLVVMPLITILLLGATGLLRSAPWLAPVLQVIVMALSAPPAANVSQLAVIYRQDPVRASACNMLGNLLCILTMPAMMAVYQWIAG